MTRAVPHHLCEPPLRRATFKEHGRGAALKHMYDIVRTLKGETHEQTQCRDAGDGTVNRCFTEGRHVQPRNHAAAANLARFNAGTRDTTGATLASRACHAAL